MTASFGLPPHSPARRVIAGHGTDEQRWLDSRAVREMSTGDATTWATRHARIWLLAPHPDDEILALGATLALLSQLGVELHVVSVTDGEASHGSSSTWTPARLAATRPKEMRRGLDALGIDAQVHRIGLPDGHVSAHRQSLMTALLERVEEDDLLLTTCRFDGHPDHEACGDVAALAAEIVGATVIEYPVWMWHWADPDEPTIPWHRACRMSIAADTVDRKRAAIHEFTSQIEPDGDREAVLPPHVLPRFLRPFEVVFS